MNRDTSIRATVVCVWYWFSQDAEVCLADYCDVLHCDAGSMLVAKHEQLKACKQTDMAKRRHRCEAVGHRCFPPEDGANMAHLHGACSCQAWFPHLTRLMILTKASHRSTDKWETSCAALRKRERERGDHPSHRA